MSGVKSSARYDVWWYSAAWLALLAIYSVALAANGIAGGLAVRNAIANLLPDALLGLAVLRLPSFIRWPESGKGRFFAAHVGLLMAFLVLAGAGWVGLVAVDSLLFSGHAEVHINFRIVPFRILYDVLIYFTLAGAAYASRNAAEVREQAQRAATAEALRARASLEAMRSQLNPHFILNTFHALLGLVRRDPATAESALERLGDLLRYTLRVQRDAIDEVPLADECAFVVSYLALEQLRLGDRLRVRVDTPPATLDNFVPTFALQILAENAIRHAIAPRTAGGLLHIRAQTINGQLCLEVQDECAGEVVPAPTDGAGIGLRLLRERLAALYGTSAMLTLQSVDGGTRADLTLPARRFAREDQ
ncbi:MAG: histidine kinase [Acidobacteriota bacterium]